MVRDTLAIAHMLHGEEIGARQLARTLAHDGAQTLALFRMRQAAARHRIPGVEPLLRRIQTFVYGVHIEAGVELGEGVLLAHTVGVVIGGNARIGDRVMFLGNNTVGSVARSDFPTIGNEVIVGAGARIIGNVHVGNYVAIGANAVVTRDVPENQTAAGIPAVARPKKQRSTDGSKSVG